MKAYLGRRYRFSASHRLHAASLSEEANRATFGKCNNPYGHGHNYIVEVIYGGEVDLQTGMVANLTDLDTFAAEHLLDRFGQANLNMDPVFAETVPTTENLAAYLYGIFAKFPQAAIYRIHVEETSNNSFDFCGSDRALIERNHVPAN